MIVLYVYGYRDERHHAVCMSGYASAWAADLSRYIDNKKYPSACVWLVPNFGS